MCIWYQNRSLLSWRSKLYIACSDFLYKLGAHSWQGAAPPATHRRTLHPNLTTALTHGVYTEFSPFPSSARLALPAEACALQARRLRRPARRARRLIDAGGSAPAPPSGDTSSEPNHRFNAWRLHRFRPSPAPRGSRFLRKLAPCGRGGCAAPLAALGGQSKFCA